MGSHITVLFTHFSIATKDDENLTLLNSLNKHFGLDTKFIGYGDPKFQKWGDFNQKIKLYHDELKKLSDGGKGHIVMLTDAYDFLPVGTPEEIVQRFLDFEVDILYNAEHYNHPWYIGGPERDEQYKKLWPDRFSDHTRYLNSGCIIAYADKLLAMYERFPYSQYKDDQAYHHDCFLKVSESPSEYEKDIGKIGLDRDSALCFCAAGSMESLSYDEAEEKFVCSLNNTHPILLHFNASKDQIRPQFEKWNKTRNIPLVAPQL